MTTCDAVRLYLAEIDRIQDAIIRATERGTTGEGLDALADSYTMAVDGLREHLALAHQERAAFLQRGEQMEIIHDRPIQESHIMTDYPAAPLATRLNMLREAAGMSLSQLARKAGVGRSTVHGIEQGKASPSYDTICKVGKALGVRPAALTDGLYDISDDLEQLQNEYGAWLSDRRE